MLENYQTVSWRSTLAIWVHGKAHQPRDPSMPLRLFAGRCARATRKKSHTLKETANASSAQEEETQKTRCQIVATKTRRSA